jgi:uncharacterized protein (DUF3084 family)
MKYEDFLKATTTIAQNLSNQGLVTETLTQLADAYRQMTENHTSLTEQSSSLTQQINALKEQNMNLFLRQGNPVTTPKLNEDKPLSYEDLLSNEFGVKTYAQ